MKKVIITGGAGFIGSHLAEALLSKGYKVRIIDYLEEDKIFNLFDVKKKYAFEYINADITNLEKVKKYITKEFDTIFHLASLVGIKKYIETPHEVINVNILGTQNVIKVASELGQKVIYSSTSEIYGKNPEIPWSENSLRVLGSTFHERWTYSSSKAVAEHLVLSMVKFHGLNAVVIRFFNVYGPRQNPIFVVSQNMKYAFTKQPLTIYRGGMQTRCFTFVKDAIEATIELSIQNKTGVFNIGSNKETSVIELLDEINAIFHHNLQINHVNVEHVYGDSYDDIDRRIPDVTKIEKAIGWKASTSLKEGLIKTKNWVEQNSWWLDYE